MDSPETSANLGTPLGADLGAIERELAAFWGAATPQPGEAVSIRACSCNLVVVVSGRKEAEALPSMLADVAEWHPCRSLVAFQDLEGEGADAPPMQGWIGVQCRRHSGGGPQVCSEVITVGGRREAAAGLANALLSLLVPDLPVYLYWRSPRVADRRLIEALTRFANLMIADSRESPPDIRDHELLRALLSASRRDVPIRDLAWSRLTAWRDLITQFFDIQASRSLLRDLSEVEIRHNPSSHGDIPMPALLLAGWLASRLDWHVAAAEPNEKEWIARMLSPQGKVLTRFISSPAGPGRADIVSVALATRGGYRFSVVEDREQSTMTATAAGPESKPLVHTVPCPSMSEANLLIGELSLPGDDTGFQAALAAALKIEKSFGY